MIELIQDQILKQHLKALEELIKKLGQPPGLYCRQVTHGGTPGAILEDFVFIGDNHAATVISRREGNQIVCDTNIVKKTTFEEALQRGAKQVREAEDAAAEAIMRETKGD